LADNRVSLPEPGTLVSRKLGKTYEQPRKAEAIDGNRAPENRPERLFAHLVPEDALGRQRSRPASCQREKVESGFRRAPSSVLRSQLVCAISNERDRAERRICAGQGQTSRSGRDEVCQVHPFSLLGMQRTPFFLLQLITSSAVR